MLVLLFFLFAHTFNFLAGFNLVAQRHLARSSKIFYLFCIFKVFPVFVIFLVHKYLFNFVVIIFLIWILLLFLKLKYHFLELIYCPSINIQSIFDATLLLFHNELFEERLTIPLVNDFSHQIALFHHSVYLLFIYFGLNLTLIFYLELIYFLRRFVIILLVIVLLGHIVFLVGVSIESLHSDLIVKWLIHILVVEIVLLRIILIRLIVNDHTL